MIPSLIILRFFVSKSGNGTGIIKLYDKVGGGLKLVDEIEATHIGCEYGEYDNPHE